MADACAEYESRNEVAECDVGCARDCPAAKQLRNAGRERQRNIDCRRTGHSPDGRNHRDHGTPG